MTMMVMIVMIDSSETRITTIGKTIGKATGNRNINGKQPFEKIRLRHHRTHNREKRHINKQYESHTKQTKTEFLHPFGAPERCFNPTGHAADLESKFDRPNARVHREAWRALGFEDFGQEGARLH